MSHEEVVIHSFCNDLGNRRRVEFEVAVMLRVASLRTSYAEFESIKQEGDTYPLITGKTQTSYISELVEVSSHLIFVESMRYPSKVNNTTIFGLQRKKKMKVT